MNIHRLFAVFIFSLIAWSCPALSAAQGKGAQGPVAIFLTFEIKPENRARARAALLSEGVAQFEAWKSAGVFKNYLLLFPNYVHMNTTRWDFLVILDFETYGDTDNWKKIERSYPGGLSSKLLELVVPTSTNLAQIQSPVHAQRPQFQSSHKFSPQSSQNFSPLSSQHWHLGLHLRQTQQTQESRTHHLREVI
jgi:hypothetical protein